MWRLNVSPDKSEGPCENGNSLCHAVGSGQNVCLVDERASTELTPSVEESHLQGRNGQSVACRPSSCTSPMPALAPDGSGLLVLLS